MKRTTNQRNSGYEEEGLDLSECPEETDHSDGMTNASPCENISYHLQGRNIFYDQKQEADTAVNNASEVQQSALLTTNNIAQSSTNTLTEKTAVKPSSKADIFTQQQQASKYITDSTIDNFTTSEPPIMMLPNEMLIMIFSYLNVHELSTSVAPVCKHWHLIAHSPVLWRKLCFEGDGVSTEFAKKLITKSPQLKELIISKRDDVEELLSHLCKTSNIHVESVEVTQCSKSEVEKSWEWGLPQACCLNSLIKCCPKIRKLKLINIHIRSDKFYDNLGILLPNLTCLHLSHSHYLTPKQIKNIATKCCNLAELCLSGEICSGSYEDWKDAYCTLFQQRRRTLTHLEFDARPLRHEAYQDISLCMNLKSLHLYNAVHLHCEGLTAIGILPNLTSLKIDNMRRPCQDPIYHFQDGALKNLKNLSLAGSRYISDKSAYSIAKLCPQIQVLSLAFVEMVTDKGIETILKHCSSLQYLDICEMKNVTGSSFTCIPQYAHNLKVLVIEELCETEKEEKLNALIRLNSKLQVYRLCTW